MKKTKLVVLIILVLAMAFTMTGCDSLLNALEEFQQSLGISTTEQYTPPEIVTTQPPIEGGYDSDNGVVKAIASTVVVQMTVRNGMSSGAGIIYKKDTEGYCYIITNYHVINGYDSATSTINVFSYGKVYGVACSLVGGSSDNDIAVLKTKEEGLINHYSLADYATINSNPVAVGMDVLAVGNPNGEGISVTSGIVSVDRENIQIDADDSGSAVPLSVIRMDAPVNHGNSGGGLFDNEGNLVGIVNAKSGLSDVEGVGYAIPVCNAMAVADKVIANGSVTKYLLGITTTVGNSSTAVDINGNLLLVQKIVVAEMSVKSTSIGYLNDIRVGDVIVSVKLDDEEYVINRNYILSDLLLAYSGNGMLVITIERDGAMQDITIDLSKYQPTAVA